jgi:hypothetical protein
MERGWRGGGWAANQRKLYECPECGGQRADRSGPGDLYYIF